VRLRRVCGNLKTPMWVKLEFLNPGDRSKTGWRSTSSTRPNGRKAQPGGTIVRTRQQHRCGCRHGRRSPRLQGHLHHADKMSSEKVNLLKAYGAKWSSLRPMSRRFAGIVLRNCQTHRARDARIVLRESIHNPDNIEAHYLTTGRRLEQTTDCRLLYCRIGTGAHSRSSEIPEREESKIVVIAIDRKGRILHWFKTKS